MLVLPQPAAPSARSVAASARRRGCMWWCSRMSWMDPSRDGYRTRMQSAFDADRRDRGSNPADRARARRRLPLGLTPPAADVDARAMELAAGDEELKAALFRFVDVAPACHSVDDLARHLIGFLSEVQEPSPPLGRRDAGGGHEARPGRARPGGVGRCPAHGAPVHRRGGHARGERSAQRPLGTRDRVDRRPARRGDRDRGGGRQLRPAL